MKTLQDIIENTQELILSDARGVYIPRDAVESLPAIDGQLTSWERDTLKDPENEHYWEAWENVLNRDYEHEGKAFNLFQDGDLFAYWTKERQDGFDKWEEENPELDLDTELERLY